MAPITRYAHAPSSVTIQSSDDTSSPCDVSSFSGGSFLIPAGFDGSNVTFEQADTDGVWGELLDSEGNAYTVPVTADAWHSFPPGMIFDAHKIRIVSDATESADRSIKLHLKG